MNRLQEKKQGWWRMCSDYPQDDRRLQREIPELAQEHFGLIEELYGEWSRDEVGVEWVPIEIVPIHLFRAWLLQEVTL